MRFLDSTKIVACVEWMDARHASWLRPIKKCSKWMSNILDSCVTSVSFTLWSVPRSQICVEFGKVMSLVLNFQLFGGEGGDKLCLFLLLIAALGLERIRAWISSRLV